MLNNGMQVDIKDTDGWKLAPLLSGKQPQKLLQRFSFWRGDVRTDKRLRASSPKK